MTLIQIYFLCYKSNLYDIFIKFFLHKQNMLNWTNLLLKVYWKLLLKQKLKIKCKRNVEIIFNFVMQSLNIVNILANFNQ